MLATQRDGYSVDTIFEACAPHHAGQRVPSHARPLRVQPGVWGEVCFAPVQSGFEIAGTADPYDTGSAASFAAEELICPRGWTSAR